MLFPVNQNTNRMELGETFFHLLLLHSLCDIQHKFLSWLLGTSLEKTVLKQLLVDLPQQIYLVEKASIELENTEMTMRHFENSNYIRFR